MTAKAFQHRGEQYETVFKPGTYGDYFETTDSAGKHIESVLAEAEGDIDGAITALRRRLDEGKISYLREALRVTAAAYKETQTLNKDEG